AQLAKPCVILTGTQPNHLTKADIQFLLRMEKLKQPVNQAKFLADKFAEVQRRLPVGASRIGFAPDLPPASAWPTHGGKKLVFLAQLDLSAMPRWEGDPLPADGWLYFFEHFPAQQSRQNPW